MKAVAWNNGDHIASGVGYGLIISRNDRDKYFDKKWKNIYILLLGDKKEIEINISKNSFLDDTCRELIKKEIGVWLISNKHAPWPKGRPPVFDLVEKQGNHFRIKLIK